MKGKSIFNFVLQIQSVVTVAQSKGNTYSKTDTKFSLNRD